MPESETPPPSPVDGAAFRSVASVFDAMGHPERLKILLSLAGGPLPAGGVCEAVGMTQTSGSRQLKVFRLAKVVETRREGRRLFYRLTAKGEAMAKVARKFTK